MPRKMLMCSSSYKVDSLISKANEDFRELIKIDEELKVIKTSKGKVNHYNYQKYAKQMYGRMEYLLPTIPSEQRVKVQNYLNNFSYYLG